MKAHTFVRVHEPYLYMLRMNEKSNTRGQIVSRYGNNDEYVSKSSLAALFSSYEPFYMSRLMACQVIT